MYLISHHPLPVVAGDVGNLLDWSEAEVEVEIKVEVVMRLQYRPVPGTY